MIHSGKAQSITLNPLNDTSFIKKFAILCSEHKAFKELILKKDSIIQLQEAEFSLLGLQLESCKMQNDIFELDSDQKSALISQATQTNEGLKMENEKLARKLKRQKRAKWVFGGIGFVCGLGLFIL